MLKELQNQLRPWQEHNFPNRPAWQPLLGLQEELGELSHAFLKREQNIRINENHNENIRDAVADILIFLCDFCNVENIDLETEVQKAWSEVSKRDWRKVK
jgi:NTP pyrophosphatase (non-canonical NTP hydrolase)